MHLDDGLKRVNAHAVKNRVAQDAGIVDDAVQPAKAVDRHFYDLARRYSLGDGFEIRHRRAAALPDFLDDFFGRRSARSRSVGGDAGIVDNDLGALRRAKQGDLATDTATGPGDDDGLVLE